MRNFTVRFVAACSALGVGPGWAQDEAWSGQIQDDGAYVYGLTQFADLPLYVYCLAPSADGKPPQEVGADTFRPMAPYTWRLEADRLLIPGDQQSRDDIALILDGVSTPLPEAIYVAETQTWAVDIPMADPALAALQGAETLVLAVGEGPQWGIATTALADALGQAVTACADAWQADGAPRPDGLTLD